MQWPLVQMPGFSEHSSTSESHITRHHQSISVCRWRQKTHIQSVILTHRRLIRTQTLARSETQGCVRLWNQTHAHDHWSSARITVCVCVYTVLTLISPWADLTGVTPPLTWHSTTATHSFSCVERLRCQTASVLKLSVTIIHTNICVCTERELKRCSSKYCSHTRTTRVKLQHTDTWQHNSVCALEKELRGCCSNSLKPVSHLQKLFHPHTHTHTVRETPCSVRETRQMESLTK